MTNPFLDLFERQAPSPVKARLRAVETRQSKREQEGERLSKGYRAHRQRELEEALAGPDGAVLRDLQAKLVALTLETIPTVTAFVRAGGLRSTSADTLFLALRTTSESIISLREKRGLPPFDDPLPGDPATPEQELRAAFADQQERSKS